MIAVVDYGAGNLASVRKAFLHLGKECLITADAAQVLRAEKLVIPGVGNFKATQPLTEGELATAIQTAIAGSKPVLGVCLGLQWMFEGSDEAPRLSGLGVFRGRCTRFSDDVKSPHVGWNQIDVQQPSRLLLGVPAGSYVYFTHSYRAPVCEDTSATCTYGTSFTAAAENGNVFGVQFHPEKSGDVGLQILENFCGM